MKPKRHAITGTHLGRYVTACEQYVEQVKAATAVLEWVTCGTCITALAKAVEVALLHPLCTSCRGTGLSYDPAVACPECRGLGSL